MRKTPIVVLASSLLTLASLSANAETQAATSASVAPAPSVDFRAEVPKAAALPETDTFVVPAIREARLRNGIRVLLIERHALPIVDIHVASTYGASQVVPGIAGFASEVASLNTDRIASRELAIGFSSIGAEAVNSVSFDSIDIAAKCLTPRVDRVAELVAAIVFTASFDSEDVDRQRTLRLRDRREAARRSVPLAVAQALFPAAHPFHDRLWGSEDTIEKATPKELRTYWREAFTPARMTITVTGDVFMPQLLTSLEMHFGDIKNDGPRSPLATVPAPPPTTRASIIVIDKPRETQGKIAVAAIGPAAGTDDEYAMRFANTRLSDVLRSNLRETEGITYGVRATLDAFRTFGEFSVDSAVETPRVGEALAKILSEIERLSSEEIDPASAATLKSHRVYRTPALFGDLAATASSLARLSVFGLPLDTWKNAPLRIGAVTAPQVRAVAARYLRSDALTIVIAGDAVAIVPQLESRKLGPIRIVR